MPALLETLLGGLSALEVVFWLIAIGGLIAAIVKLWPALRNFVRIVDAVGGLPDFIARTDSSVADLKTKIAAVSHEVHLNNGSSVKDAVIRAEEASRQIAAHHGIELTFSRPERGSHAD